MQRWPRLILVAAASSGLLVLLGLRQLFVYGGVPAVIGGLVFLVALVVGSAAIMQNMQHQNPARTHINKDRLTIVFLISSVGLVFVTGILLYMLVALPMSQ